ncbi:Cytochrome P450 monooxygenase 1 [Cladobotryum mycophilum]|uniref:Cytochrome P450 monooxygenase 1 n=1 Tax=Cladobotryum mycophilum TaxID=491253 RepID=A0ABR0SZW8_9HYPO
MAILSSESVFGLVAAIGVAIIISNVIWNIFFHPLRHFPGPLIWRATVLGRGFRLISGRLHHDLIDLHQEYGKFVRIGPSELSIHDTQAWKDVYGHQKSNSGPKELPRFKDWYNVVGSATPTIVTADFDKFLMLKNAIAPAFSERNLQATESIIQEQLDLLLRQLKENSENGSKAVDIYSWLNYFSFDLTGSLSFGSTFGCLQNSQYHPWVESVSTHVREVSFLQLLAFLNLSWVPGMIFRNAFFKGLVVNERWTREKIKERLLRESDTLDFFDGLLNLQDKISFDEILYNGAVMIIAGSDTIATLLTGTIYLLLSNSLALEKLKSEVRSSFTTEAEITA